MGSDAGVSSHSSITPCISPCISTNMACNIVRQDAGTDTSPGAAEGNGAMWNTSLANSPDFLASSCSVVSKLVQTGCITAKASAGCSFDDNQSDGVVWSACEVSSKRNEMETETLQCEPQFVMDRVSTRGDVEHADFVQSSSSSQFPPDPATTPTSTLAVHHTSRASKVSTATSVTRRTRMKSSRAPRLFHTVPPTSESPAHFSSVPTLMDSKPLGES